MSARFSIKISLLFHFLCGLFISGVMAEKYTGVFEMDQDISNDKGFFNSSVLFDESTESDPTQFHVSNVGNDRIPAGTPFNFQWKYTMSQTLYLAEEIGVSKGILKGVQYEMNNSAPISGVNILIWIGETNRENLVMNWIDILSLKNVYAKNTDFPSGVNKIFIPFDRPYDYNGGNLVIHIHIASNTLFGDSHFYTTEITTASRIKMEQRDNRPFQVSDKDEIGILMYNLPNIGFFFASEGLQAQKQLQVINDPGFILKQSGHTTATAQPSEQAEPEIQTARTRPATDQGGTRNDRVAEQREIFESRIIGGNLRERFSIGFDLSANLYDGDYLNAMVMPEAEIQLGFFQNRSLSLNILTGAGRIESADIFHANFVHSGIGLTYRVFNFNQSGSPFVNATGGVLYHTKGTRFEQTMNFDRNLAFFGKFTVGYEWLIGRRSSFRASLSNRQLFSDKIDGLEYGKYNDRIWSMNMGFIFYLNPF